MIWSTVDSSVKIHCATTFASRPRSRVSGDSKGTCTGREDFTASCFSKAAGVVAGQYGKNAMLCFVEDHPCGDVVKSDQVCHYSTKEGYHTCCVPEAEVVACFPRDYCDPCVGG